MKKSDADQIRNTVWSPEDTIPCLDDPVGRNPFSRDDPKHDRWIDATRIAEEERLQLIEELRVNRPIAALLALEGDPPYADAVHLEWIQSGFVGKYNIWAKRHSSVISDISECDAYDDWLREFINVCIEEARAMCVVPSRDEPGFSHWLRKVLDGRGREWCNETRERFRDEDAHQRRDERAWQMVKSKLCEGVELQQCLCEAYDQTVYSLYKRGEKLTHTLVDDKAPGMVFENALAYGLIRYPLIRRKGSKGPWRFMKRERHSFSASYENVPYDELTDTFCGRAVPAGFEDQFRLLLEKRILFWREEISARMPRSGQPDSNQSGPTQWGVQEPVHQNSLQINGMDRRRAVEAYIEEVRLATGKRITKRDFYRKVGYESRTEFERWQRRDPKRPNKAADEAFTRALREKPHLK